MKIINPLRLRACEKSPKVATALVSPFLGDVGAAGPAQPRRSTGCHSRTLLDAPSTLAS